MKMPSGANILVYGAGPLGSLFAARLQQGGHHVSLLARGRRGVDLRKHGIVVVNTQTQERTVTRVDVVEALDPEAAYDLVLVIMRKNNALDILPVLAANRRTPNVLFLGNNAAGPESYVEALGPERVLIGFLGAAGYREDHVVHCLVGAEDAPASLPFGEVDGRITERTLRVARMLDSARGFQSEVRTDMDAWLKTHVALLFPSLAPALYAAATDNYRLARTRDLLVLTVRAVQEGFRVLRALDIPITPAKYRRFAWLPEPVLVWLLQRLLVNELMEIALVRHAEAARDEVRCLADEFKALAAQTSVLTPAIDELRGYLSPEMPPVPEGATTLPLRWGKVIAVVGAVLGGALTVSWLYSRARRRH